MIRVRRLASLARDIALLPVAVVLLVVAGWLDRRARRGRNTCEKRAAAAVRRAEKNGETK